MFFPSAIAVFAAVSDCRLLVVGASGGTGARVIKGLLDVGYKPSQLLVTTRDPSKPALTRLREMGVELRQTNLDDPASLVGIGTGFTGCYLHSTAGDTKKLDKGEVTRARNLAKALQANGTPVAFNSAAAGSQDCVQRIAQKHAVERVLSSEFALPTTNLRANLFSASRDSMAARGPLRRSASLSLTGARARVALPQWRSSGKTTRALGSSRAHTPLRCPPTAHYSSRAFETWDGSQARA
jgi:uncharacterized protein YbjT (DUF2867 family)